MKQLLTYGIVNGLFVACLYCGLVLGMTGPLNIAVALGWLTVALTPIIFSKVGQKVLAESPTWKRVVDAPLDVAVAIAFIWYGYAWLGSLYLLSQLLVFSCWRSSLSPDSEPSE